MHGIRALWKSLPEADFEPWYKPRINKEARQRSPANKSILKGLKRAVCARRLGGSAFRSGCAQQHDARSRTFRMHG
jgi:hypothetical protein